MQRTRYRAHTVRGLVDSASPLGIRWIFDDACEDEFAANLNSAQRSLFRFSDLTRPDHGGVVGDALWGEGHSPSLVWHAQAIGLLLEFGFSPTGDAIREHLEILRWRLGPDCCRDPSVYHSRDPWLLRTRHVAWVTACLAELPRFTIDDHEEPHLRAELERARESHNEVIQVALDYLLGRGDAEGPSGWTGFDGEGQGWHEHWGLDELNALNSLYSMVAICRAERHGWLEPARRRGDTPPLSFDLLSELFDAIVVRTDNEHPQVLWDHGWPEPWARSDLPDSVVALLVLALLEYAGLFHETATPRSQDESHALAIRDKARRLAQVLVFRALDRSFQARRRPPWTLSVDAFIRRHGSEEWAEGEWFMPSYSLGARAVLEAGVVSPSHKVIRDAFKTIQSLRFSQQLDSGKTITFWADPTRRASIRKQARVASREAWHAAVDIRSDLVVRPISSLRRSVTPAGLHAAAMAWAALRRAAAKCDPQDILAQGVHAGRCESLFDSIEIERTRNKFRLWLTSPGGYKEEALLKAESAFLILALAQGAASESEIRKRVGLLADEAGHHRRAKKPSGLENAVKVVNRRFGAELITRDEIDGVPTYNLAASIRVRSTNV